ncbi:bacterial Ig-like domain-containing protein [Candidatus Enterococcus ikei]|uniref:Bacterial Ig-like domain-containing protein n=1 Tax=Candidatus Enterococcus ikei TaxID=2815326 RepID=A0ABS3H0S3_9ENTE|nr:bacterial Ig-like domain-containing protein [Enterococcus sp. DIV0869a]
MKKKPLILGTALLFSSALFVHFDTFYGEEMTTPGKYKMTYEVDGKVETATVEVKKNQTELLLKDIIIKQNEHWSPLDNVVSLKDRDGEPLDLNQVTIKHNINTQETGLYFVKFSYKTYVSIAKVSVNQFTSSAHKKRVPKHYSQNDSQTKIMLNDELLKNDPAKQKININTSGGANPLGSASFGNMLGFLSGTLLYGTRRV